MASNEETIMVDVNTEDVVLDVDEVRRILPTVVDKNLQNALRQLLKQSDAEEETKTGMYIICKLGLAKQDRLRIFHNKQLILML